jgi:carbon storage regulator
MLVLGRKTGEKILIGDDITVAVLAVNGDKVKIAVDAPKGVKILRGELVEEEEE